MIPSLDTHWVQLNNGKEKNHAKTVCYEQTS